MSIRILALGSLTLLLGCGHYQSSELKRNASANQEENNIYRVKDGSVIKYIYANYDKTSGTEIGYLIDCSNPLKRINLIKATGFPEALLGSTETLSMDDDRYLNLKVDKQPKITCNDPEKIFYKITLDGKTKYFFSDPRISKQRLFMIGCQAMVDAMGFSLEKAKPIDPSFIDDLQIFSVDDRDDISCLTGATVGQGLVWENGADETISLEPGKNFFKAFFARASDGSPSKLSLNKNGQCEWIQEEKVNGSLILTGLAPLSFRTPAFCDLDIIAAEGTLFESRKSLKIKSNGLTWSNGSNENLVLSENDALTRSFSAVYADGTTAPLSLQRNGSCDWITTEESNGLLWARGTVPTDFIAPKSCELNVVAAAGTGFESKISLRINASLLPQDKCEKIDLGTWDKLHKRCVLIKENILIGHSGHLTGSSFSPDGKYVLTASNDGTARIWDSSSGAQIKLLAAHVKTIFSSGFSPDGKQVMTGSMDGTTRIWDTLTGSLIQTLTDPSGRINGARFSRDGKYILTDGDDGAARIWDSSSGKVLYALSLPKAKVSAASFSPDYKYILTISTTYGGEGTGRIWDASNGDLRTTLVGHTSSLRSAVFSPDGKYVLTASGDRTARIWDASDGRLLKTLSGHSQMVGSAVFSPDGKYALTASADNTAIIWDVSTGASRYILTGHTGIVSSAIFSEDSRYVLTAAWDNTSRIWDASTGALLKTLKGHTSWVNEAAFSPDGTFAVTASSDNTARIWNIKDVIR
jgi:WD40 repeat protein